MDWEPGIDYDRMYRDEEECVDMWCQDCKEVVRARLYRDDSVGYSEWQCPVDDFHTLSNIGYCKCGEPMEDTDTLCPGCQKGIRDGWFDMLKTLSPKLDPYDVRDFICDELF